MVTIHDVARAAGVGIGTVSRVLSGSSLVAPETRRRIQAAIEQLDYRPNRAARALSSGRTQTIEVLVPLFTRYFYVEVLCGIEAAITETGYSLVLQTVERPSERDQAFANPSPRRRADGLLIVSLTPTPELVRQLMLRSLPAVLVDGEHPDLPSVSVDHEEAARRAVRHLMELGHERIALVDRLEDPFTPGTLSGRQRGYRAALDEAGVPPRPGYEIVTDYSREEGRIAVEKLMLVAEPPTAILAGSDAQAAGALEAARHLGRRVPDDLAVVGYNDVEIAEYLSLTTMRVPMREMGRRGVALLLGLVNGAAPRTALQRVSAELVVRSTCGAKRRSTWSPTHRQDAPASGL
ncbi:MAG: LacI family DNA-binding transcriptional regulator [Chloroflexi bacterium]|nr:LacI family DNA-binding transcriptional regulator [Chloroflexota bacterium]